MKAAKYDMPRIAEGKCLKLLHDKFDRAGLLEMDESDILMRFCPECDLKRTYIHEGLEGNVSPQCLDGIATVILRAVAKSLDWGRGSDTDRRAHSRWTW